MASAFYALAKEGPEYILEFGKAEMHEICFPLFQTSREEYWKNRLLCNFLFQICTITWQL